MGRLPVTRLAAILLLLLLPAVQLRARQEGDRALLIRNVSVVDVESGRLRPSQTVLIREGRITRVAPAADVQSPPGATVVEGRGKFLIPGLWDMHVHLSIAGASALPLLVANGVTGVRDMGGDLRQLDGWRRSVAEGEMVGPSIVRAGPVVDGPKEAEFRFTVTNAEQARRAARALEAEGVDFIKVHNALPRDAYFALTEEARKRGIRVAGHIPKTVTPREASNAGQLSIEHTETLFEGTFAAAVGRMEDLPQAVERFRRQEAVRLFSLFARNHTAFTPILVGYRGFALRSASSHDPREKFVSPALKRYWEENFPVRRGPPEAAAARLRMMESFIALAGSAQRQGVTMLAGSDLGARDVFPGFSLHDELELLVEGGLSPADALRAATLNPARVLGRQAENGSVEPDHVADLVLLDANPLDAITNTQKIAGVVLNGRYFDRKALDGLLAEGEKQARESGE